MFKIFWNFTDLVKWIFLVMQKRVKYLANRLSFDILPSPESITKFGHSLFTVWSRIFYLIKRTVCFRPLVNIHCFIQSLDNKMVCSHRIQFWFSFYLKSYNQLINFRIKVGVHFAIILLDKHRLYDNVTLGFFRFFSHLCDNSNLIESYSA